MKPFFALLCVWCWHSLACAQTPVTYKVWCTLHGGAEKEYILPNNVITMGSLPVELPNYGRAVCQITQYEAREKTGSQEATPASLNVSIQTAQQLQPANEGSYQPLLILNTSVALVYNKRFTVLETPDYSVAVELTKN